jgi:hypothetical protein
MPNLPIDAATWLEFMPHLGDHRFSVLDINAQALVGDNLVKIVCPQARRLSCTIPTAVSKYTTQLSNHMHKHKVLQKLHQLYSSRDGNFTEEQRAQLKSLDQVHAEGMLYAEKKCQKLSMGNVDFSPEVALAQKR